MKIVIDVEDCFEPKVGCYLFVMDRLNGKACDAKNLGELDDVINQEYLRIKNEEKIVRMKDGEFNPYAPLHGAATSMNLALAIKELQDKLKIANELGADDEFILNLYIDFHKSVRTITRGGEGGSDKS